MRLSTVCRRHTNSEPLWTASRVGEGVWSLVIKTERLTFALRRLRDGEEWYWSCKVGSTCDYSERLSDSLAGLPLT